jgi:hypothetical protein
MRGNVRQPLLVGMRAYRLLVTVPAWVLFACSISFLLALAGPDLPLPGAAIAGKIGSALSLALCISPIALVFVAVFLQRRIRQAIATRACDLVLSGDQLRVAGGQDNGFTASLTELGPDRVRFSPAELTVHRPDGWRLRVPVPPDPDERASREALATVLGATALARVQGGTAPDREPPNLIRCGIRGCSAWFRQRESLDEMTGRRAFVRLSGRLREPLSPVKPWIRARAFWCLPAE